VPSPCTRWACARRHRARPWRQRLDAQGSAWFELVDQINERLLALRLDGRPIDFGLLANGYCPVDIDTFAMDNGDSAKEGVGRTYAGVDGYCPLAAYLGTQGYCLQLALRPGTQHSACESQYNLEHVLPLAARLSSAPLLLRADSGFCSKDLMLAVHSHASALGRTVDYLIKWNPRSTPVEAWAQAKCADEATVWCLLREGQARLRVAGGCRTGPGRGRSAHHGPAHLPPDRAHHRPSKATTCCCRSTPWRAGAPACPRASRRRRSSSCTASTAPMSSSIPSSRPTWGLSDCPRASSTPTT
jgi:hypothetical protein